MSQGDVASNAGVSQGTIGNIESGARKNPRELLAIAAAVGVNAEWLKSGKGAELPPTSHIQQVLNDWRLQASSRSQQVLDNLILLAKKNELRDEDWQLIEQMATNMRRR